MSNWVTGELMTSAEVQKLLLDMIRVNPDITEKELLKTVKLMVGPRDADTVKVSLIEGLFYGGLITVRLTEDGKDRAYKIRERPTP